MAQRLLDPVPPSAANLDLMRRRARIGIPTFRIGMLRWVRITVSGHDHLPRHAPVLLLGHHAGFFDPPMVTIAFGRQATMLATASNFRDGPIGRFMVHFGAVPKMKYTADARAIISLKRWADAGASVCIFPEGERSWDGRRMPLVPGTDKLVRLLGLPVVTFRVYNGFRQSPRWAERMRRGRTHVEFDPPRSFARDTPLSDIRRYIDRQITVDLDTAPKYPLAGGHLAAGISNVMWACPACYAVDGLAEAINHVHCRHCGNRWRVDYDNALNGLARAPSFTLPQVVDRVVAHYGELAAAGQLPRRPADGALLVSEPMRLLDITGRLARVVGAGRLVLRAHELAVEGELAWRAPLESLLAITVDMRRRLTIRIGRSYLEAVMPRESVLKWVWFVESALQRVRD